MPRLTVPRLTARFYLLLSVFAALIFAFNYYHLNQQNIFLFRYLPLADNLLHGSYALNGISAFYPIWGYPVLCSIGVLVGSPTTFITLVQFIFAIVTIPTAYSKLRISPSSWHIPLLLPYFALMSVKWPDAIVAALLLLHVVCGFVYLNDRKKGALILSALCILIAINFRTEYLLLAGIELIVGIVFLLRHKRNGIAVLGASAVVATLLGLTPWAIRAYEELGKPLLVSTNGGSVAYISLGQLPNNPWHIVNSDTTAFGVARRAGIPDPYSLTGDDYLQHEFTRDIEAQPVSYGLKALRNTLNGIVGGVYTGEFGNALIGTAMRDTLEERLTESPGFGGKVATLRTFGAATSVAYALEKLLRILSMPLLLGLFLLFFFAKHTGSELSNLWWLLLPLVLYRFLTIAAIQYEPRHMNLIYAPLLIFFLLAMQKSEALSGGLKARVLSVFGRQSASHRSPVA